MKFTYAWLKDFLETKASVSQISEALTKIGFEVESVDNPAEVLSAFKVARVARVFQHPQADRLSVCEVETEEGMFQVVCGAPNVRSSMHAVFAPLGSVIPATGVLLAKGVLRGVESFGMLCSGQELLLSEEGEGILEVSPSFPIGTPVAQVFGKNDPVFHIKVTPNRPDALGVYGLARDLSVLGIGRLKPRPLPKLGKLSPTKFPVTLKESARESCPYFVGRMLYGVRNGPSPQWLSEKLLAVGLRPISAIVDITNYMALTFCRPLHAFDLERLGGEITIDLASGGEDFLGLDGKSYSLEEGMTVITSGGRPQAIAGVLGGDASGCSHETRNIFLESAYFHPIAIADAGRKLNIFSDARYRFERGVDPCFVQEGLDLAASMIMEICGGTCSELIEVGKVPECKRSYLLPFGYVKKMTGLEVSPEQQKRILLDLGFALHEESQEWSLTPPSWRPDILGTQDLVEEIIRIVGVDQIPAVPLCGLETKSEGGKDADPFLKPVLTSSQSRVLYARRKLASAGLHEVVTWSFLAEKEARLFGGGSLELQLVNPISSELGGMRPSLFPNLLRGVAKNQARGFFDFGLFEIGQIYENDTPSGEKLHACAVRSGNTGRRHWLLKPRAFDLYDAKTDLFSLLETLGLTPDKLQMIASGPSFYHPGRVGAVCLGPKRVLATFGELHPKVCEAFEIKGRVVGFSLDLSALPEAKKGGRSISFNPSDFMSVKRDFSFIVQASIAAEQVVRAVFKAERSVIERVTVFDIFQGEDLPKGSYALALEVILQPKGKSFTDSEIEAVVLKIIAEVEKATGAILRG